jgi:hypothetical protein
MGVQISLVWTYILSGVVEQDHMEAVFLGFLGTAIEQ